MKIIFTIFKKNILLLLMFFGMISFQVASANEIVIPFDTVHWEKVSCSPWQMGDSLTFYGADYRAPGIVETRDFYDLSQAEVYIKWKVNAAGKFMAATLFAGGVALGGLVTTDHTCCNSKLIQENKWYYTQVKFNSDTSLTAIRSTGNFYDQGGTLFDSLRKKITLKQWNLNVKNGKIKAMLHDNYGGDKCSFTLASVILKNVVKNTDKTPLDIKTFNFEDGKIPSQFISDSNSTWSIADTGFQSHKSIFLEQTPGHTSWLALNVVGAYRVSFDVRFISGYSWNTIMSASFALDTLNMVTFDRSNKGCWTHYEWLIPEVSQNHNLRWYSSYSGTCPQNNSKLWIDNIKVYYAVATGINTIKHNNIQSIKVFPVPVKESATIEYRLAKPSFIRIEIYDITGKRIQILSSKNQTEGTHRLKWYPYPGLVAGTYFCKITTDNGFALKKLLLE